MLTDSDSSSHQSEPQVWHKKYVVCSSSSGSRSRKTISACTHPASQSTLACFQTKRTYSGVPSIDVASLARPCRIFSSSYQGGVEAGLGSSTFCNRMAISAVWGCIGPANPPRLGCWSFQLARSAPPPVELLGDSCRDLCSSSIVTCAFGRAAKLHGLHMGEAAYLGLLRTCRVPH